MPMLPKCLLAYLLIGLLSPVMAQDAPEDCPDDHADYCFSSPAAPGVFVAFTKDVDQFRFYAEGEKRPEKLPFPSGNGLKERVSYFREHGGELAPADVLIINRALTAWDSAKTYLGFTKHESGLWYKIDREGDGPKPKSGDKVKVHYRGQLLDGTEFDSSHKRGKPIEFPLGEGRVIKGWDTGIQLFREGGKGTLIVPPELGYGSRAMGNLIPPNSTLVFDIELVEVPDEDANENGGQ